MAYKTLLRSIPVARYVNDTLLHESEVIKRLRAETAKLPAGGMQISSDQGAFLTLLCHLLGVRKAIEIGTFTGYSAMNIVQGMPADGRLICCDISVEWTSIARRYWAEAKLADRIDLRLAPANDTLTALLAQGAAGSFDLAFIDADKDPYESYYEKSLQLVHTGGIIVMDNMLGTGADSGGVDYDPATSHMHDLCLKICNDVRVEAMLATVGAGFLLARKK
jgi:predicted O-methyltransferase YrrM